MNGGGLNSSFEGKLWGIATCRERIREHYDKFQDFQILCNNPEDQASLHRLFSNYVPLHEDSEYESYSIPILNSAVSTLSYEVEGDYKVYLSTIQASNIHISIFLKVKYNFTMSNTIFTNSIIWALTGIQEVFKVPQRPLDLDQFYQLLDDCERLIRL